LTIFEFPYVVVLTQECDLEQNKKKRLNGVMESGFLKNDGHLVSILVAPLYNAEHVKDGKHLDGINIMCEKLNTDKWKKIKQNDDSRYHYIEPPKKFLLPPSVVDFKHYFSVSLHSLEENIGNRLCTMEPLYKANLVQRFANFLSRIGLPDLASDAI
jgi:hypothetical protein